MARCDDIKLMLGPFEDGELSPVIVGCDDCEGELADYRTMAVSLRGAAALPDLSGFSAAVLARIEELPIPIGLRLRRYMTSFSGIGATITAGFAAAAVAVVTAVILTPYFRQASFIAALHAPTGEIARVDSSSAAKSAPPQVVAAAPPSTTAQSRRRRPQCDDPARRYRRWPREWR